jgi:hypothetical protein
MRFTDFVKNLHKPAGLAKTRFSAGLEQVWRDTPVFQTHVGITYHCPKQNLSTKNSLLVFFKEV